MKRIVLIVLVGGIFAACLGCKPDYYAHRLIEPDTRYGKLALDVRDPGEKLVEKKKIDLARVFEMPDKVKIDVWAIYAKPPKDLKDPKTFKPHGTVVLIHGLCDSKASYLSLGQRLANMGYDVVLPDLRCHGNSTGKYITYGAKEKEDIKAVVDQLMSEKLLHTPIYAFGMSMGAAVAIQYAAIEPRCRGVMAMAPFKDARTITRRNIAMLAPLMSNSDFEAILARAGKIADFNPNDASPVNAVKNLHAPILLVHGLLDTTVPVDHSQAIYAAASEPKQIIIVPWGGHATLLLAREAWIAEQINFIATTGLKKKATGPKK